MIHLYNVNDTFRQRKQYISYFYLSLLIRKKSFFIWMYHKKMNIFTTIKLTKDNNKPNYLY